MSKRLIEFDGGWLLTARGTGARVRRGGLQSRSSALEAASIKRQSAGTCSISVSLAHFLCVAGTVFHLNFCRGHRIKQWRHQRKMKMVRSGRQAAGTSPIDCHDWPSTVFPANRGVRLGVSAPEVFLIGILSQRLVYSFAPLPLLHHPIQTCPRLSAVSVRGSHLVIGLREPPEVVWQSGMQWYPECWIVGQVVDGTDAFSS
jgi:hypothetical protein